MRPPNLFTMDAGLLMFRASMLGNVPSRHITESDWFLAVSDATHDPLDFDKAWKLEATRLRRDQPALPLDETWATTVRQKALERFAEQFMLEQGLERRQAQAKVGLFLVAAGWLDVPPSTVPSPDPDTLRLVAELEHELLARRFQGRTTPTTEPTP